MTGSLGNSGGSPRSHNPAPTLASGVQKRERDTRSGFFYALFAYGLWGFLPLYFRAAEAIPPDELTAHRIIWSLPTVLIVMLMMGRLREIPVLLSNWKVVRMMALTAAMISVNWGLYVWAISVERTSETALGYYINPLLTVLLGALLLGERLDRWQKVAVALAFLGVAIRTIGSGELPWISLVLAFSFAGYGYLRKTVSVGPTQGFLLEVMILFPFAVGYAVWLAWTGVDHVSLTDGNLWWLIGCGPVTAVPLILYAYGAKGLTLTTIGLMQYIAPTMIFCVAFFVFGEELDIWQAITFGLIWLALVIYTRSTVKAAREG